MFCNSIFTLENKCVILMESFLNKMGWIWMDIKNAKKRWRNATAVSVKKADRRADKLYMKPIREYMGF